MTSEGQKCSLCYECFDDQNHCPHILPCGHSFCSDCLEKLKDHNAIDCPTCRTTYTFPMNAGVKNLTTNYALIGTRNATSQHAENRVSPICEEMRALVTKATGHIKKIKAAQHRVVSAILKMRSDRNHLVTWIQLVFIEYELKAILTDREQVLKKELYQFYENALHMSPGFAGLPSNFAFLSINKGTNHKCLLRAEALSKCRDEMKALATNTSTDTKEIKDIKVQVINALISNLQSACKEVACGTQGLFRKLRDELTARGKVLKNKLDDLYNMKQSILLEQLVRLWLITASLESTIPEPVMSDIQSLSHADLLFVRSNMKSKLEEIENQCIVLEPEVECVIKFAVDQQYLHYCLHNLSGSELVSVINNMGSVIDKSTCAATTTAAGFGLQCAPLGYEACFTITAYDAQRIQRQGGCDVFVVELKQKTGEGKVGVNLKNNGDGTYLATYTVPADAEPGDYMLSVFLCGAHIQDSPFVVRVGHPY